MCMTYARRRPNVIKTDIAACLALSHPHSNCTAQWLVVIKWDFKFFQDDNNSKLSEGLTKNLGKSLKKLETVFMCCVNLHYVITIVVNGTSAPQTVPHSYTCESWTATLLFLVLNCVSVNVLSACHSSRVEQSPRRHSALSYTAHLQKETQNFYVSQAYNCAITFFCIFYSK